MADPISLEEARRQIRLEADDDSRDDDLRGWIADAAGWVEEYTGHLLEERDVIETVRVPARRVTLSAWPVAKDATFEVLGPSFTPVAGARIDVCGRPAAVLPAIGACWPLSRINDYLTITVRAGYPDADAIPRNMKRAMLVLIAAYDADREGGDLFQTAVKSAERLCGRFRLRRI